MKRRFLITTFIIAGTIFFVSHAHASEGSLWMYMLLSPLFVMQSIPFSYTALCIIATIYCLWSYRVMRRKNFFAAAIGFIILTVLFAMGETINYQEQERNRQRVEANRARIKSMYEGKQVQPMDANKLNEEMQKHIKSSGNPEIDKKNREAAKELVNMAATLDKMNMQPVLPSRAKMKTAVIMDSKPEKIAWEELRDFYPTELNGQSQQEMEKIARERFNRNDLQSAAAIFLKMTQMDNTAQKKALYWSFAARCIAKKIDDSQPSIPKTKMSEQLKIPLSLANKALALSPDDEEVVYTAALIQYRSLNFGTAAATLKAADKRITMGLPSLHLMEVVYGLANDRAAERDAGRRSGYDPEETGSSLRPYECNIWLATCEPSEDLKKMNADGSAIMTRETILGGLFLLLIVLIAGFAGWLIAFRVKGKSNALRIHSIAALGAACSSIIIISILEASSASLFKNAFSPWFQFIMTLPTSVLIAYVAGCFIEKLRTKYSHETSG